MGALQPMHLAVILVVVLIVFGPGKLTDVFGQLGKGVRQFRKSTEGKSAPEPQALAAGSVRCPSCQASVTADALFCTQCGARTERTTSAA